MLLDVGSCPPVEGSELRLGQVFVNLLVNAAHAITPGRAFDNRVEIKAHADEQGWAAIEVRDTGAGIPAEIQAKIFDPFFTTKRTGTGLGLSVSYGIIQEHGGTVDVRSQPGAGTSFILGFPAAATAAP